MTNIMTLTDAEQAYGLEHLEHLDRAATLPTISVLGFQGDVSVRRDESAQPATDPIPVTGIPVVRGENGGNTHLLIGTGCWRGIDDDTLALGVVTIADGDTALLSHPEHGGVLLAPGTYRIGRQREWRGEWARVAD